MPMVIKIRLHPFNYPLFGLVTFLWFTRPHIGASITQNYISWHDSTMNKLHCIWRRLWMYFHKYNSITSFMIRWTYACVFWLWKKKCETESSQLNQDWIVQLHNFEYICCVKSTKIITYTPKIISYQKFTISFCIITLCESL
jgi:hypothetical protein